MGTNLTEMEVKVARLPGFYESRLIEAGETFTAPVELTGRWFVSQDDIASGEELATAKEPSFLDQPTKDIVAALPGKTTAEVTALIAEEQAGKARKGLLAIMSDQVANAAGAIQKDDPDKDEAFA